MPTRTEIDWLFLPLLFSLAWMQAGQDLAFARVTL